MKTDNYTVKWIYADKVDTICVFLNTKTLKEHIGITTCSKNDNFRRDTGRKLSLARARRNAGLSKEERKDLWECYRNTKPGGRW